MSSRRNQFMLGARDVVPMLIGAAPLAIIYGGLAVNAGLTAWQTLGMSALVFAGSAQFIAVSLMGAGAGVLVILLTTLVVNLRHALYSASMQPYIRHLPKRWRIPLAFGLTDESYAVSVQHYLREGGGDTTHWYFFGASLAMYLNWIAFTGVGVAFGQAVPNLADWGLDFAMLATFIGIVVPSLRNYPQLAAALVAAAVALACNGFPYKLGLMAAALAGIVVGVVLERRAIRGGGGGRIMSNWLLIIGMLVITFAIRYSLFAFPDLRFPPLIRQGLHYVPTAVLTAIVVPGMVIPNGSDWQLSLNNAYLLAGLMTIAIAAFTRHLLATIAGGLLVFFLLRWWLGQLPI